MADSYVDCLKASSIDSVAAVLKTPCREEIRSETMLTGTITVAQSLDFKRPRSVC